VIFLLTVNFLRDTIKNMKYKMKYILMQILIFISICSYGQELITIRVTVPNTTDEVFITGNQEVLGNWKPDKVKMNKIYDFEREIILSLELPAEFKFTKGDWNSEGITGQFYLNENCKISDNLQKTITYNIKSWKNELKNNYYNYPFEVKKIKSLIFDDERIIAISLPENYDKNKKYSVIYTLDANTLFETTMQIVNLLSKKMIDDEGTDYGLDNIPECIVVGVFHNDRNYETNPNLGFNSNDSNQIFLEGSLKLKDFLISELVPFINSEYSTSGFNSIIGHSNTGHFVLNLATVDNNPFNGFICLSVNSEFSTFNKRIKSFLKNNNEKIIYFGYGKTDNGFKELAIEINNEITNKLWTNKNLLVEGFQAGHNQLPVLAIMQGLKFIFNDYKNLNDFNSKITSENQNIESYINFYINKHIKYGVFLDIDDNLIVDLLELTVETKNTIAFCQLIDYLESNKSIGIPKNLIVYYAKELGDTETAEKYIKKVIESSNEIDYHQTYSNLVNTYLSYYLDVKKSPSEALKFLEIFISKEGKHTLIFSFFYAKIGIEYGIEIEQSKKRLKYCEKNFYENPFFEMIDVIKLKK